MRRPLFFIYILCFLPISSQIIDDEITKQLVNDIQNRKFEKAIPFIESFLSFMELDSSEEFQDSIYIGMTSLLTTAYVQSDQPLKADSILSHAINYYIETKKTTPLVYLLFSTYGGLWASLENYHLASMYLDVALQILEENGEKGEEFAAILSMQAECHRNLDSLEIARQEIKEAIKIIDSLEIKNIISYKIGIYQKAGAIYGEIGLEDESERFTKLAYDLSKDNPHFLSEYINSARNLAIIYLNHGKYNESLEINHNLEKQNLTDIEKANIYNSIFLANYFLNHEEESVNYSILCSKSLKNYSSALYLSLPANAVEYSWEKTAMQLKVNMGILDKFSSNPKAIEMCYDNALFIKNLSFSQMKNIRILADRNKEIKQTLSELQNIKASFFAGNGSLFSELNQIEKKLYSQIRDSDNKEVHQKQITWCDVKQALKTGEYAVEIISFSGFEENTPLKYGALILSSHNETPQFTELCTFQELHEVLLNALIEQEWGINQLYQKGTDNILYNLIWKKIDPYLRNAKIVYVSPLLDLQDINIGFIPCPDNKYVNEKYHINIVSSTSMLCNERERDFFTDGVVFGGIEYTKEKKDTSKNDSFRGIIIQELSDSTRGAFGYLQSSEIEVDSICRILRDYKFQSRLYKGIDASESSFKKLNGNSPSIIHFATHGFYLVGFNKFHDYFSRLRTLSIKDSSMLLSGLLMADANTSLFSLGDKDAINDGVLTAEEISWMDLSKTKLVVLSACESAIGTSLQEGIGGLLKAFKNAGVEHIIASLWKVPDGATASLMISFYKKMASGTDVHIALKEAQKEVSKLYPDPYYWASFIIVD